MLPTQAVPANQWLIAVLLLCIASACSDSTPDVIEIERRGGRFIPDFAPALATSRVALIPVALLGWESPDSAETQDGLGRKLGGGLLGRIADIAEAPNGDVLILDGEYHKIVRFGRDGTYQRVVVGGYGQGPGEFIAPRSLSVDDIGRLYVLDRSRLDVQVFSATGELLHSFHLPYTNPLQAVAFDGRLYVRRFAQDGRPVVMVHDSLGSLIDSTAILDDRASAFMLFGEGGRMTKDTDDVVYGLATPGRWLRVIADSTFGHDLEPAIQPVVLRDGRRQSRAVPIGVRGIATLPAGTMAILWDRKILGGEGTEIDHLITILSSTGKVLQSGQLEGGPARLMVGSTIDPSLLLLARSDPFPHVAIVRAPTGEL